jgi:hypothetical protein
MREDLGLDCGKRIPIVERSGCDPKMGSDPRGNEIVVRRIEPSIANRGQLESAEQQRRNRQAER